LYRTPTDGLTGTVNFSDNQFQLRYWSPPESQWTEAGVSVYRAILRVDARSIPDWLSSFGEERSSWQTGSTHQYLVDRRDGDGKRVINTTLQLPHSLDYLGADAISALAILMVVLLIGFRYRTLPALAALILIASGILLNLSSHTFGLPFSYIALGWPFWSQLALHILGSALLFGALVQLALTFLSPLEWYTARKTLILTAIYGLYPAGLFVVLITQPELAARITGMEIWQQQAGILLRGLAYGVWGAQYRRASVSQRGQLHWVLAATAAYDLPILMSTISGHELPYQSWLGILPPLGYLMATLPDRRLRFRLNLTSSFIHVIANTLMAALFLSGLGLAANFLLMNGQSDLLPAGTIGLAILFALTTMPLMGLLREQLDRWFNGTRGAQRALLHQFTGKASDQIALSQVTNAFYETLEQGVQPAYAALWLWDDEAHALQSLDFSRDVPTVIPLDKATQSRLLELSAFTPDGQLVFWPDGRSYYGAISLISSGTLVGVCAIGPRIDGGNYSNDALRFLETLTGSATLAFRNAQLVSQLEDKIGALRNAYQQLITAQETERRNLAAELHDETLQQLAHANLITAHLEMATNGAAEQTLQQLHQTITLTERRLREILKGVHPAVLTDLGLEAAIRSWLPHPPGIAISFVAPDFAGRRLPDPLLEMTLYRLIQEGTNNALKHAQATHVAISLQWRDNQVMLEVSDDGVGFSPAHRLAALRHNNGESHFGLLNLNERVRAFGGELQIDSQPGKGTRICAQLPVKEG
jgi:signal transduction histidine kinase